jgi:hypothetical protein
MYVFLKLNRYKGHSGSGRSFQPNKELLRLPFSGDKFGLPGSGSGSETLVTNWNEQKSFFFPTPVQYR